MLPTSFRITDRCSITFMALDSFQQGEEMLSMLTKEPKSEV
jgi:hypothetical protein